MLIEPTLQRYWDWRAAGNFIAGGSGAGLLAALWLAADPAAALLAVALVATGLVLVWFKLGRPERSINVLRRPDRSWMAREAWLAPLLLGGGLAYFAWPYPAVLAPLALAGIAYAYAQARILSGCRGIPAWRGPESTGFMLTTNLAEGAGLALVFTQGVVALVAALLLLGWRAFALWRLTVYLETSTPMASHRAMAAWWPALMIIGHGVPALLLAQALAPGGVAPLAAAGGLLLAAAGWLAKARLILRAGHTQGFAIAHTPARGSGKPGPGARPGWQEAGS